MRKILLLFTGLSLLCLNHAYSQLPGWNSQQRITITENSGDTVSDYQLKMYINTYIPIGLGEMDSTGNDIRFGNDCAGSVLYPYWIEGPMNSDSTVIWVKIDTLLPNATKSIYMIYNNPSASPVSAVMGTFFGPNSSTDSVASGASGGVGNSQRGFRFAPNEDLLVTSFGKNEPTGTTRYITLFDINTQAILSQIQVSGPAGQYTYNDLASPMWLTQGTQYTLQLYQDASDGYYFGSSSQIGQHLTYYDMRYCNGCTQNTFPTSTLSNYHYGYPDLWYYTKKNVSPAPTYSIDSVGGLQVSFASDLSICMYDTIALVPTVIGDGTPFIYSWSPLATLSSASDSIVNAFPTSTTTYTLSVTNSCNLTKTDSVVVNVYSLPVVSAGSDQIVCEGSTVTLSGSGAVSYSWTNGITDGVVFTPALGTTDYIVTGTDSMMCSNTDTVSIIVLSCAGVDDEDQLSCRIYPNPSSGIINISGSFTGNVCLKIIDIQGKTMMLKNIAASSLMTLDLSALPEGTYQLIVENNLHVSVRSLIISK